MKKTTVTILLPCLNEEESLEICINDIKKEVKSKKYQFELLVIDNGSTDNSINILKKNRVKYYIENKKGYGSALRRGIKESKSDYIIMLDSDNSYDSKDILKIVNELDDGYDFVMGNRFAGNKDKGAMSISHMIGSKALNFIANILFCNNIKDYHSGIRGFKRTAIKNLDLNSNGMEFASEMVIKAKLNKLKTKQIPVNYKKDTRTHKSNLNPIRDGLRHLSLILSLKFKSSIIFRFISVFLITSFILISILYLSTYIPKENIDNNTYKTMEYYYNKRKVGYLNNTYLYKDYYKIDYPADIKSVSMSYLINPNKRISSLIEMNYYPIIDFGFMNYTELINENYDTHEYSRYWQGQTIYLRLLLNFISGQKLYIFNTVLAIILLIILNIMLLKESKFLIVLIDVGLTFVNFFIVPYCFEYFLVFIISFIISMFVIKNINNRYKLDTLFITSGILTCFFDFLTCETLSLTIPLFILVFLRYKNNNNIEYKEIIKYIILWGLGYSLMFALKWIIAFIYYGFGYFNRLSKSMSQRLFSKDKFFISFFGGILKMVSCLFLLNKSKYYFGIFMTIFLFAIYFYIFYFNKKERNTINKYLLICLVPLLRFLFLSLHVNRHYYFTYRALIPFVMVIILIYKLIIGKFIDFYKNNRYHQ